MIHITLKGFGKISFHWREILKKTGKNTFFLEIMSHTMSPLSAFWGNLLSLGVCNFAEKRDFLDPQKLKMQPVIQRVEK